jgi:hypothetical protein
MQRKLLKQKGNKMVKKHHAPDYVKNKTADVIPHDWNPAVPDKQWEERRDFAPTPYPTPIGAFNAMPAKRRPCTHHKVNECDH